MVDIFWNFQGGWGGGVYCILTKMENPKGVGGVLYEIPSVVGVWIFSVRNYTIQFRSKISKLRIRIPYASNMRVRMLSYVYVLPLLFIAIPLLYVALSCTTKETVK